MVMVTMMMMAKARRRDKIALQHAKRRPKDPRRHLLCSLTVGMFQHYGVYINNYTIYSMLFDCLFIYSVRVVTAGLLSESMSFYMFTTIYGVLIDY